MPSIIDHYDDPTGVVLTEIFAEAIDRGGVESLPAFVKGAEFVAGDAYRREKTAFAWPAGGRFPCDTPLDTWLSAMYFEKTSHLIGHQHHAHIREKLARAAELHNVTLVPSESKSASAAVAIADVFALEAAFEASNPLVKRAGQNATPNEDGTATIRLYPVTDREKVAMSVARYPFGLEGDLADFRTQLAQRLMEKCAEFGVNPSALIVEDVRPIKRSSIVAQVQYRMGLLKERVERNQKYANLYTKAASRGVDMPYEVTAAPQAEPELLSAYEILFKQAYESTVGDEFWNYMASLDKLAGFDRRPDMLPAASMRDREILDDRHRKTARCADNMVNLAEVMAKVSTDVWEDIAPHVIPDMSDFTKLAEHIEKLPAATQQIILAKTRGW